MKKYQFIEFIKCAIVCVLIMCIALFMIYGSTELSFTSKIVCTAFWLVALCVEFFIIYKSEKHDCKYDCTESGDYCIDEEWLKDNDWEQDERLHNIWRKDYLKLYYEPADSWSNETWTVQLDDKRHETLGSITVFKTYQLRKVEQLIDLYV